MKNRQITLLDLGLDTAFDTSMQFAQAVLSNMNTAFAEPVLDIDFVRSRELSTISATITGEANVLHVMAHGDHSDGPTFWSSDGKRHFSLDALADTAQGTGSGIRAGAVLTDACKTATGPWKRSLRNCIPKEVAYIGTRTSIGWYESTIFVSAFYGALARNMGKGSTPVEQGLDAAERAIEAYEILTDRKCPYVCEILTPSRAAKKAFS